MPSLTPRPKVPILVHIATVGALVTPDFSCVNTDAPTACHPGPCADFTTETSATTDLSTGTSTGSTTTDSGPTTSEGTGTSGETGTMTGESGTDASTAEGTTAEDTSSGGSTA